MTATPTQVGVASAKDQGDEFAQLNFVIRQLLAQQATVTIAKVLLVNNSGGVSPVGMLDAQPIVHQMNGAGQAVPHAPIHNLPYLRIQGGQNAFICDPQVGDLGIVVFASRDISKVKNTRAAGLPGSKRTHDWADGMYLGGILNGVPVNYIQFDSAGNITLKPAAMVTINGALTVTGDATINGIDFGTHRHTGVSTGGGESGGPIE